MPAYPELRGDPLIDALRRQEGHAASVKNHDYSRPYLLDRENREQTRREDAVLSPPVANDVRWRAMGAPPTMGELAALDRYGVQPGVVGQPLPQYAVDRALRQAGPGVPEGQLNAGLRFPDVASERQAPPPLPYYYKQEDVDPPGWANVQQGTPEFWRQGITADDPNRGVDL